MIPMKDMPIDHEFTAQMLLNIDLLPLNYQH